MAEWVQSGKDGFLQIVWCNIRCLNPEVEDGGVADVFNLIRSEKTGS